MARPQPSLAHQPDKGSGAPWQISYNLGEIDFGAGDSDHEIKGPPTMRGEVIEVHVSVTETFTDDTLDGFVRVGSAADEDEFAELDMGTTAAGTALGASGQSGALKGVLVGAAEDVQIACYAPTGGTPAGKGHITIVINWFE